MVGSFFVGYGDFKYKRNIYLSFFLVECSFFEIFYFCENDLCFGNDEF